MLDGLDHILIAASDLARGCDVIEAATGVRPEFGGAHPGRGTCNALASLGSGLYLEVIAPDPEQSSDGELVRRLRCFDRPALGWWAARCANLAQVNTRMSALGLETGEIKRGHRLTASGDRVEWSALYVQVARFGAATPFLIDWGAASHHPSKSAPRADRLTGLEIALPDLSAFRSAIEVIELGPLVTCRESEQPSMTVRIESPKGDLIELRTPGAFPPVYPPRS